MCVQHTKPHVLICQNNQNALDPLTSQFCNVPTGGGKCSDMQYAAMFAKGLGGFPGDAW